MPGIEVLIEIDRIMSPLQGLPSYNEFLSIIIPALQAKQNNCNFQLNNDIMVWKKREFFVFLTVGYREIIFIYTR